jgi:hypothetical protein
MNLVDYPNCHNPILGYSQKIHFFFQNQNQKNKIKAHNVEKAGWEIKLQFLEEIQGLIVPHYTQEWRKKYKFKVKLNDYWMNLHKN